MDRPRVPMLCRVTTIALAVAACSCQMPPTELQSGFMAIRACFEIGAAEETPAEATQCLDDFIADYAERTGQDTRGLLADMEAARQVDLQFNSACHPIAHAIGRYTFQALGQVGDSFNACDQSCHSGCFHGVMERLFADSSASGHISVDELRARVPTICTADNFEDPSQAEIFQCLHGLGHAILYTVDYALPLGLQVCDTLADAGEQQICATGVVMENVTAFDKDLRDIDPTRPLYPCDTISSRYQATCFRMQTSLMLEYGLDLQAIEDQCNLAGPFISDCFTSLGRDYSAFFLRGDISDALAACEVYSTGHEDACISGVVVALIDNMWDARFAYPYCNLLMPENQAQCFRSSNFYLSFMYGYAVSDIVTQCERYAFAGEALCLDNLPPALR